MKIRQGFVSNSSSCSFTCSACGCDYDGWDWDEPKCPRCNRLMTSEYEKISITNEEEFLNYLAKKYNFNIDKEKEMFDKIKEGA